MSTPSAEFYATKLGFVAAFTEGDPPTFAGVNLDCVQILNLTIRRVPIENRILDPLARRLSGRLFQVRVSVLDGPASYASHSAILAMVLLCIGKE